ncbi:hypothetical protein F3Y22_tig00110770pilonHSYRG00060 [Hibiscus syriacus]|uniref:RING/U-box superfamily protein n=1 Tax=Hibiscus syriacus TaxID=106335 RepID=A0A6A2ZUK9_HIBSY|nr:hypothetical protein F3Y22_tig00110770pilonHSYRG00060 [Hibiscus syriacus]
MASPNTPTLPLALCRARRPSLPIHGRTLFFIVVLVLVTLIVALVFVYARWACRFNRKRAVPYVPRASRSSARGLDPATINSLPVTMFTLDGMFRRVLYLPWSVRRWGES